MPVVPIRPQPATPSVRPPPPPIFQLMAAATMAKEGKIDTAPGQQLALTLPPNARESTNVEDHRNDPPEPWLQYRGKMRGMRPQDTTPEIEGGLV